MLTMCWTCAWGCVPPPMFPNAINGRPSFVMKLAMMVMNGRFRGAIGLAQEASPSSFTRLARARAAASTSARPFSALPACAIP
jgi:hypothetical protein